jgi:hypothetical protein
MSSFMSNKFLRYRQLQAQSPRIVEDDRPCASCGYNLRGLVLGQACPECGAAMDMRERSPDVLLRGDVHQRRRTRTALALVMVCLLVAPLTRFALFVGLIMLPFPIPAAAYVGLGCVLAIAWGAGVFMLTTKDMDALRPAWRWLRLTARCTQSLWLPAYACWMLSVTIFAGTAQEEQWAGWGLLLRVVAGIGALAFLALLMFMAVDAELEDPARRLHRGLWLVVFPSAILIAVPANMAWIGLFLLGGVLLWWCWLVMTMGWSAREMHSHVAWDLRITADQHTRHQRIASTRASMDRDVSATVRPVDFPAGDMNP